VRLKERFCVKQARNEYNNKIGEHLKSLRNKDKLTQSKLAKTLKVSFQQIQKFENGTNRIFAHQLLKLCHVYGWKINEFSALINEFKASESSVSVLNKQVEIQ